MSGYGQGQGYGPGGSNQQPGYGYPPGYNPSGGSGQQSSYAYGTGYPQQRSSDYQQQYQPGQPQPVLQGQQPNPSSGSRPSGGGPEYNWSIPADGILREVIQVDIQRYLGADAHCKPGKNERGDDIYHISAYRNFTHAMIQDLKADSLNWRNEKHAHGENKYEHSQVHRSRQYWGPTGGGQQAPAAQPSPSQSTPASAQTQHYSAQQSSQQQQPQQQQQTQAGYPANQGYSQERPASTQYPHGSSSGYQSSQYSNPSQSPVSAMSGYGSSTGNYTYSAQTSHTGHTAAPRTFQQPSQTSYSASGSQYPSGTPQARPGFYIASDGREYPLSQQPGK